MVVPRPHRLLPASTGLGAIVVAAVAAPPLAMAAEQLEGRSPPRAARDGARPLAPGAAVAEALVGFPVIDGAGQPLGRIVDVVGGARPGEAGGYAVLSTGGVRGVDAGLYPIPVGALRAADATLIGAAPGVPPADRWPGEPEPSGLLGLEVEALIDREVWSETGEPVARIDDVVLIDRRPYLVLSVDGFLGVADEEVVLPVERFELRIDEIVLTRPITEDGLEALAPQAPEAARSVPPELTLAEVMAAVDGPGGAPFAPLLERGDRAASDAAGPVTDRVLVLEIDRERLSRAPDVAPDELSADAEPAWRDDVLAFYRDLLPAGAAPATPSGADAAAVPSNQWAD